MGRKFDLPMLVTVLFLQSMTALSADVVRDFDFFYFVQQWPGSYCDTAQSCCYPTTGKPRADFGIHGLWPNFNNGSFPSNCDPDSKFDESLISDLVGDLQEHWPTLACPSNDGTKFWSHEWEKHGTCSESLLSQHAYFQTALGLKSAVSLLDALGNADIIPDGSPYNLDKIKDAIRGVVGYAPGVECNYDSEGNPQLYQIYLCVAIDNSGSNFIECPIYEGNCSEEFKFPAFSG